MKTRLNVSFVSAGVALILLTGCVSSRKYKASQAELAKVRNDSSQLAQQVSSLNGNVNDLQNRNTSMQRSLDSSSSRYATTQHSLDYYQNYFKDQQASMSQVNDDVKGALTQAGIANADVQQVNNTIYVRLDEDELFKKNSAVVTPGGKKALDGLAEVIKSKSNVNVFVGSGDTTIAPATAAGTDMSMSSDATPKPRHHRAAHYVAKNTTAASGSSSGSVAATTTGGKTNTTPTPAKVHHRHAEGSMAIYNGTGHMRNRSMMVKEGRMVMVANHFLHNGVPKIHVTLKQPGTNPQDKTIRLVITPKMEDFNPQSNSAVSSR